MDEKLSEFRDYLDGWMNRDIKGGYRDYTYVVVRDVLAEFDERFGA